MLNDNKEGDIIMKKSFLTKLFKKPIGQICYADSHEKYTKTFKCYDIDEFKAVLLEATKFGRTFKYDIFDETIREDIEKYLDNIVERINKGYPIDNISYPV